VRVFRGSLPEGQGRSQGLCYGRGFVQVYNYLRLAVARGQVRRVPLLFCGKTSLGDMKTLAHLVDEGLVEPPRFVPPQFADLRAADGVDVLRRLPQSALSGASGATTRRCSERSLFTGRRACSAGMVQQRANLGDSLCRTVW
jgi:hypothetical protein